MIELISPEYGQLFVEYCPMNIFHNNSKKNVTGNCIHMLNNGNLRIPCSFGKSANCYKCRSVTMVELYSAIKLNDKASLNSPFNAYYPRVKKDRV